MNCPIHNVPMEEKSGQYGVYYSHIVPNAGYCNGKKITPFKTPQPGIKPYQGDTLTAATGTNPMPKPRDYEAEGRGKVRHGFSLEAYKLGKELNAKTIKEINDWTEFVMTGSIVDPKKDEEPTYP